MVAKRVPVGRGVSLMVEKELDRRHTLPVMAGRVPAIFALTGEARMAGTRPAMTISLGRSNPMMLRPSLTLVQGNHVPAIRAQPAEAKWPGHARP